MRHGIRPREGKGREGIGRDRDRQYLGGGRRSGSGSGGGTVGTRTGRVEQSRGGVEGTVSITTYLRHSPHDIPSTP